METDRGLDSLGNLSKLENRIAMSYSLSLEIECDGMRFKNQCKKNEFISGEVDFVKVNKIPALISETVEAIINLPLKPYGLSLESIVSTAVLIEELSGNRYVTTLTNNSEVVGQLYYFQAEDHKYYLYDKTAGVNLKL